MRLQSGVGQGTLFHCHRCEKTLLDVIQTRQIIKFSFSFIHFAVLSGHLPGSAPQNYSDASVHRISKDHLCVAMTISTRPGVQFFLVVSVEHFIFTTTLFFSNILQFSVMQILAWFIIYLPRVLFFYTHVSLSALDSIVPMNQKLLRIFLLSSPVETGPYLRHPRS